MGIFSAVLGGLSIATSIFGASKEAENEKEAIRSNTEIALANAETSRENAFDVVLQGRQLELDKYEQINRAIGSTRAAAAGAGLEVDAAGTVTAGLVDDMRVIGAIDIQTLRDNVILEKKKFEQQEQDFLLRAKHGSASASAISPGLAGFTAGLRSTTSAFGGGLFDEFL